VAEARGVPAGPVHLNWPLRKPLDPTPCAPADTRGFGVGDPLAEHGRATDAPRAYTEVRHGALAPTPEQVERLVELVIANPRGVIACGPQDATLPQCEAVARLARLAGWPVLAEPTSQLRRGPHVEDAPILATRDFLLRDPRFRREQAADVVLRLGATPVSKAFETWLAEETPAQVILVDPGGAWNEPGHRASQLLRMESELLCRGVAEGLEARGFGPRRSPWLGAWLAAEERASERLAQRIDGEEGLFEPRAVRELCDFMPDDGLLYVSSSMPVRDLDAFMPVSRRGLRVLCNRGANGIDGMLSSALGAAAADAGPTFLLTGDLAFLHDLGGLLVARRYPLRATLVVLNNDGGGIFSFLPIAEHADAAEFEEHFATPHGLDLQHAASLYALDYTRVDTWPAFREALEKAAAHDGVSIIEVPVDRDANLAHFRSLTSWVRDGLSDSSSEDRP
jgi:2-succinyl-5-enolpyruvyl-6-hydroxy-3-cyclohexene-1-carboxylate synthase